MNITAHYNLDASHKLLTDNRDFYTMQSAMTKNGVVPTMEQVKAEIAKILGGAK